MPVAHLHIVFRTFKVAHHLRQGVLNSSSSCSFQISSLLLQKTPLFLVAFLRATAL